ncbi:MAG: protease Lon-related BREX system protein BrxL, partial [Tissierellia bacterium]|nr:protease Lon-related BREX system protein BrxL [Tissierellia bacterium]
PEEYPTKYDRLLAGGIWCMIQLDYDYDENELKQSPIRITNLKPIQMPQININELKDGRSQFTKAEWIDIMLRSVGMEPDEFNEREKWLLLTRLIPLVENNFNLCELGPRSTGKSHVYKEVSPNSILVSGGQSTVANLFYNMSSRQVGLVGLWDCVAFDEVAGIKFKDKDGIQIMKDYMASGSFARGKEEKAASASMVFVGNINQSVDVLLKTSSLFDPFPEEMAVDTAFLDRMHCYLPGWEIPKFSPQHFTNDYGFITDYLAEFMRELRKDQYGDSIDKYFRLGKNLNQRDTIAVRKMVNGYLKLVYPHGEFSKEDLEEILCLSLEMRRRVKEQLKKIGGMEFYDVNFSYVDLETFEEKYVGVPEQGADKLIPDGILNPGQVYTVANGGNGMIGCYRLESQMLPGNGKFERTGLGTSREAKEASNTAFNYLKANGNRISNSISTNTKNYIINYQDLQGIGMTGELALPTLIALSSIALGRPVINNLAILGEISIGGSIIKVSNIADSLQVALDSGAKKILIPSTSFVDFATVPAELMSSFQIIPYQSVEDAVFKALGVE